jgi:glutamyl-tRNA reductase
MERTAPLPLAVVGVSHRTAPVEVRERLAVDPDEAQEALHTLRGETGVQEAVVLSTCNRTEFYLFPALDPRGLRHVEALFHHRASGLNRPASDYLFRREGEGAVRHLFQVSSGLDSMVTGEAEIQGQVRAAYERALAPGHHPPLAGPVLNRLFQMALSVGGAVRSETPIAEGTASVASVALELARKIFGSLRGKRVLVLGAGSTAELMVQALARDGVRGVFVANRTLDRAVALAERLRGHAITLDRLSEVLPAVDIVLASTSAPHPVLTREHFRGAYPGGERRSPLLAIDIALPRDIDPRLGDEPEVFLYNLDDLEKIVEEHVKIRVGAVPAAEAIIERHSEEFRRWYASLEMVPVIRSVRERAEAHRRAELDRLFRGMEHLGEGERARVEAFSRRLMNKLLHEPTARLRQGPPDADAEDLLAAARYIFGVESGDLAALPDAELDAFPNAEPDAEFDAEEVAE